jgi:hypothetical protein
MHDIDRTQLEQEQYEQGEFEQEYEQGEQFLGNILGALVGGGGELEVPLHETQEMELASELLEISSEEELEQFLGNVFRTVGNAVGQFARSDTGRALGGILKDAARQALPVVGGAIGGAIAPGVGSRIGSSLAQQAGTLLGLELEGLSPQEQEFEAARQFVRLAGTAYRQAALAPRNVSPRTAARTAAVVAARRYAPGLVRVVAGRPHPAFRARRAYRYGRRPYYRPAWTSVAYAPPAYYEPDGYAEPGVEEPYGEPNGDFEPAAQPNGGFEQWGAPAPSGTRMSGIGSPALRGGRWVRRGRVIIVYGT